MTEVKQPHAVVTPDGLYDAMGSVPYEQVLQNVQAAIAVSLSGRIEELPEAVLKEKIERYITDHAVKCALTSKVSELAEYIYHDMAGLSFITRERLFDLPGFEELDINAWDAVEIVIAGRKRRTDYRFLSPEQALDIHSRMFRKTQTTFNNATPRATADIGAGIRITALKTPLVDESVAVVSSIRKVNTEQVSKDRLLAGGTLTAEMLDLLSLGLEHGVSLNISGETGAGKTTLAGCLLSDISERLRTYTIEEGSREWDFVRRDADGRVRNSVIHTKTMPSADPRLNVDQEALAKDSLRFDPDIIAPGETRGREAYEIMELSNTGHTVVTTTHSNGTEDTPGRMVGLAKKAYNMDDSTLFTMAARAFPLLVHIESCADHVRRVTEIREVTGYQDGAIQSQMLYEFEVAENIYEGEECVRVEGSFRQTGKISDKMKKRLMKKGARRAALEPFVRKGGEKSVD